MGVRSYEQSSWPTPWILIERRRRLDSGLIWTYWLGALAVGGSKSSEISG